MLRVVVIGARRRRQGIGEFVARAFAAAGTEVRAIVGTRPESVEAARRTLAEEHGIDCRGHTSVREALRDEQPDLVAVCSPYGAHREHLSEIANYGCHCLCEKPLWWEESAARHQETEKLVDGFVDRGLFLGLLAQWPYTLPAFYRLYPMLQGQPAEQFTMHMGPTSTGREMVLDAASHPLSMLQHLVGYGAVENCCAKYLHADERDLCLDFAYVHADGKTQVRLRFTTTERPPRPASYAINGNAVSRRIQLPEYDLFFEAERGQGRRHTIKIGDPLQFLVEDCVRKVENHAPADRRGLVEGVAGLEVLYAAVPRAHQR